MTKVNLNSKNVAKFAAVALGATIALTSLSGCGNKQIFDTTYKYTHAVIFEEGKTTIIPIKKWNDYDGEQLQLVTKDGNVILTSAYDTKLYQEVDGGLSVEDFAISLSSSDAEIGYLQEQDTSKVKSKN